MRRGTCSKCVFTAVAAKAWSPPPSCCRSPLSRRHDTPRRSRASAPSAPARRSSRSAGSPTGDPHPRAGLEPDALIVQDPTLLHQVDVFGGLRAEGYVLINSGGSSRISASARGPRLPSRAAARGARVRHRTRELRPAATERRAARRPGGADGCGRLESVEKAIRERFNAKVADGNCAAASACYERVLADRGRASVLEQLEGSQAVARTVALCRPQVIPAYPISPQTHIVEGLSAMVARGDLAPCEFLNVESEYAAMSVAIGASPSGRAPTRRPPARGCCTWRSRSTTPQGSGCRS